MEEILAMVDGMAGEDGKVEAAALKEALKERLSDLQKSLRKKKERLSLSEALVKNGAKDVDYLLFRLEERAKFGEEGELLEEDALISGAKEEFPAFFNRKRGRIWGVKPGEGESGEEMDAEEFGRLSYRQRVKLFEEDPELYHSLQGENRW